MIFVTDKGQLCINIIQYGHLYAWGREHGRRTMSMRFAHKYSDFHISHTRYHYRIVYLLAKLAARAGLIPTVVFQEMGSSYAEQQQVMLSRRWVLASGWCVRFFDLFDKYREEIVALFGFSRRVVAHAEKRLAACAGDAVRLGVHIRRGDYATWCGGHYFYNDEQYAGVIARFCRPFPQKRVEIFICSNDPKLDRDYYRQRFGADCVHFPDGSPAEDLCLLSRCDYLTGAPSTFTLVASMYRDTPLYWIADADAPVELSSFGTFARRHREFDGLYISA